MVRVPRSARSSTFRLGRFASAMTAGQCSDGALRKQRAVPVAQRCPYLQGGVADDTDIPKGRIRRTAQVGSVVGSQGARYAGTRARNLTRDADEAAQALEQRHMDAAEQMVETLGRMKGAAMEIGQLAAFSGTAVLPAEYRELGRE